MTAELRDFARSILRMDGERVMWFERSQELAKKCDALTAELEESRARRLAGPFSLINAALGVSEDESSIEACKRVVGERDASRAELAGVAAQRDAYLSRSVELATRVTELEAKTFDLARLEQDNAGLRSALASEARKTFDMHARVTDLEARLAAAPVETAEVDGFRVGDLVRYLSNPSGQPRDHWRAIERFNHQRAVYRQSGECGIGTEFLTRKPVEVGDTVRVVGGNARFVGVRFVVTYIDDKGSVWGSEGAWDPRNLVAVAP